MVVQARIRSAEKRAQMSHYSRQPCSLDSNRNGRLSSSNLIRLYCIHCAAFPTRLCVNIFVHVYKSRTKYDTYGGGRTHDYNVKYYVKFTFFVFIKQQQQFAERKHEQHKLGVITNAHRWENPSYQNSKCQES